MGSRIAAGLAAAWIGIAGVSLSACGDDDEKGSPAATSSPSGSASESDEPTADATPTVTPSASDSATTPPGVAPATGIELREQISSIRVPERWRLAPELSTSASAATGPAGAGTISLIDIETLNPNTPLEVRVKSAIKTLPDGAKYTRLPDVMLGGSPAYHLTYTMPGRTEVDDIIETEYNLRLITLNFSISAKALKKDPDIVDSVLATFQWVD